MLGVQEKPSPSKPSRQRHLGVGGRRASDEPQGALSKLTNSHGGWGAEREPTSSPGDTTLVNAAGVWVALLGLLPGPAAHRGLVAEAAAEAWGTRAMLAHPPTARTVVT